MASTNEEVAVLLREYAELLGLAGGDQFRVRSYEKAAKAVAGYPDDLGALPESALTRVPGVGKSVAAKIAEYRRTGTVKAVDDLRATVPPGALVLAKVPGVGPKRALQIAGDLGVTSVDELAEAVRGGRLRGVAGFGPKTEERILRGIAVAAGDTALRGALRALEPDATVDDIGAVLAAHVVATRAGDAEHAPVRAEGLIRVADIRGDLHTHTDLTDGIVSLEGMIAAAEARGYEYYAVTDHAPNLVMQRMTDEKMLAQRVKLRALADTTSMVLLHGTELNIAPDGSVDWDADFLAGFDMCVASVHSSFEQDRATMTKRFITAAENPRVNIIGHPLTRKVGRRPPVQVDLDALYAACARTGTALEVNASPDRMDLPPEHIAAARDAGVKFAVDTDAHSLVDLTNMRYGVAAARFGGLTTEDVINTWSLDRLEEFLRKGRSSLRLLASSITPSSACPRRLPPSRSRRSRRSGTGARLYGAGSRERGASCTEVHGQTATAPCRLGAIRSGRRPLRTLGTGRRGRCRQAGQSSPSPPLVLAFELTHRLALVPAGRHAACRAGAPAVSSVMTVVISSSR
jgi:histidinol phosphatase-like PHP family hydrolase